MNTTQKLLTEQKERLRARMAELRADIAAILGGTADKQASLDKAIEKQAAATATVNKLADELNAAQQPRLAELKQELADVARAEMATKA